MAETTPSGIRLQMLIQNHHAEILSREKNNDKLIHLYSIGTYWVAFEQSAYRLNLQFPRCELTLFSIPDRLDYVVMASVPINEAVAYFHKHIVCSEPDYKVLAVSPIPTGHYYRWYVDAVKSVLE
ncbi:hypothetical protein [Phocaeicola sp.]